MNRNGFTPIIILLVVVGLLVVGGVWYWQVHQFAPLQTHSPNTETQSTATGSSVVATSSDLQKLQAIQAQWDSSPSLAIIPTPRTLTPIVPKASSGLSNFGLSFRIPWTDIATTTKTASSLIVRFTDGSRFVIFRGQSGSSIMSSLPERNFQSGYDAYSTAFETVPGSLSSTLSLSDRDFVLKGALLDLKQFYTPNTMPTSSKIYSFQTNTIRGFQFADASGTIVTFFGADDNLYVMAIQGTQGEIDYILSSFK
jgi:hypothetical protein